VAISAIASSFLTPEECQHTLQISVMIGVPGRRVPGLNLLVSHVWVSIVGRNMAACLVCRFAMSNFNFNFMARAALDTSPDCADMQNDASNAANVFLRRPLFEELSTNPAL
jgi:hypothetical protein